MGLVVVPHPMHLSTMGPCFLGTLPLGVFLVMHPLAPVPSAVSAQPTVLFSLDSFSQPHSLVLSPHQHLWALVPRQGHPGLIHREALGWAEETLAQGADGPAQMGAPPSAQRSWWMGKGVVMAAPPFVHHSAMMPCFYGVPGFFCRLSRLWNSLLLSLLAVFSQPTAVPSLGPCSKPHFPAPRPPLQQVTHNSGWNAQSYGVDPACSTYFVLPPTDF